ncbi:MAG TPA: LPS assembly lipoprotein LptE [Stellaceae bacterium]|nr:LPS assembly lipoprotein LptE [Stellaceae bacterium]
MSSPEPLSARAARLARRAALLAACGALAACGFHPLYGEGPAHEFNRDLAAIRVDPIPERIGQLTANSLRDSFNPTGARVEYRYRLRVVLQSQVSDFALRQDGTASRQLYNVSAAYHLADLAKGSDVFTGVARFNTSYDVGDNEYATIVAGQNAQQLAAHEISEQIRTQLVLYLRREAASQP